MNASSGSFFFFNDTATTEIYTLSLHDALPISCPRPGFEPTKHWAACSGARELNRSATGPAPLWWFLRRRKFSFRVTLVRQVVVRREADTSGARKEERDVLGGPQLWAEQELVLGSHWGTLQVYRRPHPAPT